MAFRLEQHVAEIVERSDVLRGRELWHPGIARDVEPATH
jgi:hypothetical protein